jgi:hypothetical protein
MVPMRASGAGESWNHISGYPEAVADMVHRDMVGNKPKERGKRPRAATGVRAKKLRDYTITYTRPQVYKIVYRKG